MQRIEIQNFRQIREASIEISNFTVLIGEQASGKSTVAKLIYFFKSLRKDFVELAHTPVSELNVQKLINKVRDKFYLFFGSTARLNDNFSVRFYYTDELSISLSGSPLRVRFNNQQWLNELLGEIQRTAVLINHYRERQDINATDREESILQANLSNIMYDSVNVQYIPAGRNISVSYTDEFLAVFQDLVKIRTKVDVDPVTSLPRRNDAEEIDLVLLRDFIFYSSKLRSNFRSGGLIGVLDGVAANWRRPLMQNVSNILKADYVNIEHRGEYLRLSDGSSVSLDKSSSGQQESIRVIQDAVLHIAWGEPVFRVIEEPEAHLSPTGQHRLIEILAALANVPDANNEIFITTHSPYILTILNNLILAGEIAEETGNDRQIEQAGIPALFRLRPQQVRAYMLADGLCRPINHAAELNGGEQNGLIGGNLLDNYWHELQNQFDAISEIDAAAPNPL